MTLASNLAAQLLAQLGQEFSVPSVDLDQAEFQLPATGAHYADMPPKDITDLTTGAVEGAGAFDKIMASTKEHLREQYELGRITGDQYTKAYIELTTASLGTALQFVLQGSQAYWQALIARGQARKAEVDAVRAAVELETAKYQLAAASQQTELLEAQHALVTMQLANEDAKYELAQAQLQLVAEQTEAQRGQTLDTRSDGTTIVGTMGKQKDLYSQQITSYKRDAETKAVKMFVDSWIAQKTLDEGLLAPNQFTNTEIDAVVSKFRANLALT